MCTKNFANEIFGKKNNIRFRYQQLDRESPYVEAEQLLLIGTDDLTKEMGMYTVQLDGKKKPQLLMKRDLPSYEKESLRLQLNRRHLYDLE